ncbi:MAG TPA: DUF1801 domain-containing protein, partial [Vicinamibacterales bacterium]|nr:DUF1801 domain-containing protein [Vicinamibacterales bacterium]
MRIAESESRTVTPTAIFEKKQAAGLKRISERDTNERVCRARGISIMATHDPRVDAYIAKSADFAKPILLHLRKLVHKGCPDVQETIKWGVPSFEYKGLLCGIAAFKQHCTFGFWKSELVLADAAKRDAMGSFGRITSLDDLPADTTLIAYVKKAAALNANG